MILITLLTIFSTKLRIGHHEEQDVMSAPLLEGGKEERESKTT